MQDVNAPWVLLGGLTPAAFMRRHWQKRPLLVRSAWPGVVPPLSRGELFALAGHADAESRLVQRQGGEWQVRHGPLARRALPPLSRPGWTLLVQGIDQQVPAAREMLERFRFVPDARLDDLMVSWASPDGGVGPHLDSYDVFLLQVQGVRRWRVGPVAPGDRGCVDGAALKLLRRFEPTDDWLLHPGDLLYLPPLWGHDGTAVGGDCMTCSVGFRAPAAGELARELLLRMADACADAGDDGAAAVALYRDPRQAATATPGAVPPALQAFAQRALARVLADPQALQRALGEILSEPKAQVWFQRPDGEDAGAGADDGGDAGAAAGDAADSSAPTADGGVRLDPRTRMLYDERHVYVNGESCRTRGRDAVWMRRLADVRCLLPAERARLSAGARALVEEWIGAGWAHGDSP